MIKTQQQWVIERLEKAGEVTRNEALRRYITRLSAIIFDLKDAGWEIEGFHHKTRSGKDYKYRLVKKRTSL